jgi:hypothetical protein
MLLLGAFEHRSVVIACEESICQLLISWLPEVPSPSCLTYLSLYRNMYRKRLFHHCVLCPIGQRVVVFE